MAIIKIDGSKINHSYLILNGLKANSLQPDTVILDGVAQVNPWINNFLPIGTDLSNGKDWYFNGGVECGNNQPDTNFDLPDDTYTIIVGSGNYSLVTFVIDNGIFDYAHGLDSVIQGRGTNVLTLLGVTITIDASSIISNGLLDPILSERWITQLTGNFLPNLPGHKYGFSAGSGLVADFFYNITLEGVVIFDSKYNKFAFGSGTNTLIIKGYYIIIDAQTIGYTEFWVNLNNVPPTNNNLIEGNFIPLLNDSYIINLGGYITDDPEAYTNSSYQTFTLLCNGDIITNDPFTLKVDIQNGERRIVLIKRLSQIITDIILSKSEIQVGETFNIAVIYSKPEAAILINGVFGASKNVQYDYIGKRQIVVTASINDYFEIKTISINVIPYSGIANLKALPILKHELTFSSTYHSRFSISEDIFNQRANVTWDFGDGSEKAHGMFVEHDFEHALGAETEHHNFDITCLIQHVNQPDVLITKTLYIHNSYALCKKLGTIITRTFTPPLLTKMNDHWQCSIFINNIERDKIFIYIEKIAINR